MTTDWAKGSWVMIYIFSTSSLHGVGAYIPGEAIIESTNSGSYDMTSFESSKIIRIGSKNNNTQGLSNLRKLLIFKGTGIH